MYKVLILIIAVSLFLPIYAHCEIYGSKMGESPSKYKQFQLKEKRSDGTEIWSHVNNLGLGTKGGDRTRLTELTFKDGCLSDILICIYGHGKNLAQASDDFSAVEKNMVNLIMGVSPQDKKFVFYGNPEKLGPNHTMVRTFNPEYNI